MGRVIWIILLMSSTNVCARAETRTLGLYLKNAGRVPAESGEMMRSEMKRLLEPAGIEVVWKTFGERKTGEDFDFVVVGSIEGSCVPNAQDLLSRIAPQQRLSLADTSVSANEILPFFKVNCSRLMRMLVNEGDRSMLGRALARIIAHELYHILARTEKHRESGIAKAAFSVNDLITLGLDFDPASIARMNLVLMLD